MNSFKKGIFYIASDQDKNDLLTFIEEIGKANSDIPLIYNVKLIDNRKKIPRTKVLLHYFAGQVNEDNVMYMSFETIKN